MANPNHRIGFFDTLDDLKACTCRYADFHYITRGYDSVGDLGHGTYHWDASETAAGNDGTIVTPDTNPAQGRYKLIYQDHLNVRQFGATGDGSTDDLTAFSNAIAALPSGGKIYVPSGTYSISARLSLTSGIRMSGESKHVSKLKNTGSTTPNNITIDIRPTLGSNYVINAPSEAATTVTTTTSSDAGNFSSGDKIGISGLNGGQHYPIFITTVASADSGTGIITIDEQLPRSDFSIVHEINDEYDGIVVENLQFTQAGDVGIYAQYSRNIRIADCIFTSGIVNVGVSLAGCRDCRVEGNLCIDQANGGISIYSGFSNKIIDNDIRGSFLAFEAGCEASTARGNRITNPGSKNGIYSHTLSRRTIISDNSITGIIDGFAGVFLDGADGSLGENVVNGNYMEGGGVGDYGVVMGNGSVGNVITGNVIRNFDDGIQIGGGTTNTGQIIGLNNFPGCTEAVTLFTGGYADKAFTIPALDDNATPSVAGGFLIGDKKTFRITGTTTITDFDDGYEGLEIELIAADAVTITHGANIVCNGGANLTMAVNDVAKFVQTSDGGWRQSSWSDNT